MNIRAFRHAAVALVLLTPALLSGRQAAPPAATAAGDMVDRIFKTREFSARPAAPPHVARRRRLLRATRTRSEPQRRRCRSSSTTAPRRPAEVLITAAQLTPAGAHAARRRGPSWSPDEQRVLIFTNTRRVWRTNSRGDYWLLDRPTGRLKKLGGDVPEASLMYAQFDPARDAGRLRAAERHLRRGRCASGAIRRLTRDGSDLVINGGSGLGQRGRARPPRLLPLEPRRARASPSGSSTCTASATSPLHVLPGPGEATSSRRFPIRSPDPTRSG